MWSIIPHKWTIFSSTTHTHTKRHTDHQIKFLYHVPFCHSLDPLTEVMNLCSVLYDLRHQNYGKFTDVMWALCKMLIFHFSTLCSLCTNAAQIETHGTKTDMIAVKCLSCKSWPLAQEPICA